MCTHLALRSAEPAAALPAGRRGASASSTGSEQSNEQGRCCFTFADTEVPRVRSRSPRAEKLGVSYLLIQAQESPLFQRPP